MTKVYVRNYSLNDYASVKSALEEGNLFEPTWDSEERLRKRIENKPDSIIVAVVDEDVVGCVYIVDDILPFIFRLAIKKSCRKQGLGKMLVNAAMGRLKEHGHTEIALFVDEENEELQDWYKKQGFSNAKAWRCMWRQL